MNIKVTSVTLVFKGSETINEVYKLHINEFKQMVYMLPDEKLIEAELTLKDLLSTIQNRQAANYKERTNHIW